MSVQGLYCLPRKCTRWSWLTFVSPTKCLWQVLGSVATELHTDNSDLSIVITHVDGIRWVHGFYLLLSVFLCFPHYTSKSDADSITKLDVEMFYDESGGDESHLFWGQKVKVTSHKNIFGMGLCIRVSAGF